MCVTRFSINYVLFIEIIHIIIFDYSKYTQIVRRKSKKDKTHYEKSIKTKAIKKNELQLKRLFLFYIIIKEELQLKY